MHTRAHTYDGWCIAGRVFSRSSVSRPHTGGGFGCNQGGLVDNREDCE